MRRRLSDSLSSLEVRQDCLSLFQENFVLAFYQQLRRIVLIVAASSAISNCNVISGQQYIPRTPQHIQI